MRSRESGDGEYNQKHGDQSHVISYHTGPRDAEPDRRRPAKPNPLPDFSSWSIFYPPPPPPSDVTLDPSRSTPSRFENRRMTSVTHCRTHRSLFSGLGSTPMNVLQRLARPKCAEECHSTFTSGPMDPPESFDQKQC